MSNPVSVGLIPKIAEMYFLRTRILLLYKPQYIYQNPKIKNWYKLLHNPQPYSNLAYYLSIMPFISFSSFVPDLRPDTESHITLTCHIFLLSYNLEQFSTFIFYYLDIMVQTNYIVECSLILAYSYSS